MSDLLDRFRPSANVGLWAEFGVTEQSLASLDPRVGLGDIPLRVLTAGRRPSFLSEEIFSRTLPVWIEMHRELAALSSEGSHTVVPDAAHYIHVDRPDIVIEAIRDVVTSAREKTASDSAPR